MNISTARQPWLKVVKALVPAFEGDSAWFDVEQVPGKPWCVLRPSQPPPSPSDDRA